MNRNSIVKLIFVSIMISVTLLVTFLLIDNLYLNNKYFNNISKGFYEYINYQFGIFSFVYIFTIILLTIIILVKIKILNKISIIFGLLLSIVTFNCFLDFVNFQNSFFGNFAFTINNSYLNHNLIVKNLVYFFGMFLGLFFVLFPLRKLITELILSLYSFINSFKTQDGIKNLKSKYKTPFISKVVYENTNCRVEYPVFSNNSKVKKFKLNNDTNTSFKYNEVDTFSKSDTKENKTDTNDFETKTLDKNEYFERIKQNWPEHWKKNQLEKEENNLTIDKIDTKTIFNEEEKSDDLEPLEVLDEYEDEKEIISKPLYLIENQKESVINDKKSILNKINALKDANLEDIEDAVAVEEFEDIDEFPDADYIDESESTEDEEYILPESDILTRVAESNASKFSGEEKESAQILEQTLMEFGIKAEVCDIIHGPVVTLYKLVPSSGVKLSRIEGLSTNLALRLAAQSIRIIAPIPGEKVVGIEIPNKIRELVSFKEVVNSKVFTESKFNIPIGLGKDIYGNIIVVDLYKMPHILIAGATGAGKSVCVNSFISSILFSKTPDDLRLLLIDPKIVELKPYNNIPHLLTPVITESKDAMIGLKYLLYEMERRYSLLDEMGVRDIVEYQNSQKTKKPHLEYLPFIVCFVDEFADLMTTSGKEAEILFARLAAKARAVGILLVLATQRPSADVITGLIKSNVPARIAFQVISLQDSRIILDQKGAEKLLGQGDMLYLSSTQPFPIRIQGAFLSKEEVDSICEHWKSISEPKYINISDFVGMDTEDTDDNFSFDGENKDPLFDQAVEIVYQTKKASASYLQRRLNIGYNRAARMVEQMEDMGIVGPQRGAKAREVIGTV